MKENLSKIVAILSNIVCSIGSILLVVGCIFATISLFGFELRLAQLLFPGILLFIFGYAFSTKQYKEKISNIYNHTKYGRIIGNSLIIFFIILFLLFGNQGGYRP